MGGKLPKFKVMSIVRLYFEVIRAPSKSLLVKYHRPWVWVANTEILYIKGIVIYNDCLNIKIN